jgi:hypothetical protein
VIERMTPYVANNYIPVPESGCWLWLGAQGRRGYGLVGNSRQKIVRAHRLFYAFYKGEIPAGFFVCHKCDTPMCVNPDHLFVGSPADNVTDMIKKGRSGIDGAGSTNGRAKLTEEQAIAIFHDRRKKREIASAHGVSIPTVISIQKGYGWPHLNLVARKQGHD